MDTIYDREIPAYIYKYRSIGTHGQRAWLRDVVVGNSLYFSTPDQFNDPFDCAPVYRALQGRDLDKNVHRLVERNFPHLNRGS